MQGFGEHKKNKKISVKQKGEIRKMKKAFIAVFLAAVMIIPDVSFAAQVKEGITIYVSEKGNDSNSGSFEKPLRTVKAAKERIKEADKEQPVTVVFREGTYNFDTSLEFSEEDSGSSRCPVVYKAYEGETPVFTSAMDIDTSKFTPVSEPSVLAKIPEEARNYVGQVDLGAQGLGILNPIGNTTGRGDPGIGTENNKNNMQWADLYLDKKTQRVAQWPNGEMNYDKYLKIDNAGPVGARIKGGGGQFTVSTSKVEKWVNADLEQALIMGYFGADYRHEINKIKSIDTENKQITLAYGTDFGVICKETKRYKVVNMLEELDVPGEWFVDRNTNMLYYYAPYSLEGHKLWFSYKQFPLITIDGASNIRFEGIEFFGAYGGIRMTNSQHIDIVSCKFKGIQANAVYMPEVERRNVGGLNKFGHGLSTSTSENYYINIDSCDFVEIGLAAIVANVGDCTYLKDGHSKINNCFIERASLVSNAESIVSETSMGLEITNNTLHNLRFHAINYGTIDSKTSYNEVYNCTREPYDAGTIYSGRDFVKRNQEISYNVIHDTDSKGELTGHGTNGIYLDDMLAGITVHHNIMWNTGAGIHANGGQHNKIYDNIIMNARNGSMTYSNAGETFCKGNAKTWYDAGIKLTKAAPWFIERFPEIIDEIQDMKEHTSGEGWLPKWTVIKNNIANMDWKWAERIFLEAKGENNLIIDPASQAKYFADYDNNDYRLKAGTEFAKNFPDALTDENFSYSMTGVQVTENRKNVPVFNEKTSPFRKIYPQNGKTGVDPLGAYLLWEDAYGADRYTVTVATDPEMKNVVEIKTVDNPWAEFKEFKAGETTYYWTVEAENYSVVHPSKWSSTGVPYMFTTSKYEKLNKDELKYNVNTVEKKMGKVVEGTNEGEYPAGSRKKVDEVLEKAYRYISVKDGGALQEDIDRCAEEVLEVFDKVSHTVYTANKDASFMFETKPEDWIKVSAKGSPDVKYDDSTKTISLSPGGSSATVAAPGKQGVGEISHFKIKFNWNGEDDSWFGISAKVNPETIQEHCWTNPGYCMVVKQSQLEFQAFGDYFAVLDTVNNSYIKEGQWYDIGFGAVNTASGVRFVVTINNQTVFDQVISNQPIESEGVLAFYFAKPGLTMEIRNDESFKGGEVVSSGEEDKTEDSVKISDVTNEIINDKSLWFDNGVDLNISNDTVQFKGQDKKADSLALLKVGAGTNEIVNADIKFSVDNGWQALSLRNNASSSEIWSANNYAFIFKKDTIEIQRFNNGITQYLANIKNDGIYTSGQFANVKAGAINTKEGGVRVVLYINDTAIADIYDPNALYDKGQTVFYDYSGEGIEIKAPTKGGVVLDDLFADYYMSKGTVVNNDDSRVSKVSGEWMTAQAGVNGVKVISASQNSSAAQLKVKLPAGAANMNIYYWVGISENGDENVTVTTESTYDHIERKFKIDNKYGKSGWKYLGSVASTNYEIDINVEGSGTGDVLFGAIKLTDSTDVENGFTKLLYYTGNAVVLNVGNKNAYIDGQQSVMQAAPVVTGGRTLVPIRFISEAFGAKVDWNGETASATVSANGHTLVFKENSMSYTKDGQTGYLDQPAQIINNRMMLPIRVISEDLNKSVYWEESGSGLIVITNAPFASDSFRDYINSAVNYFKQK